MNVSSPDIRCNINGFNATNAQTLTVAAGSTLTYSVTEGGVLYHPGPIQAYLAQVPRGRDAKGWRGDGRVWFKIHEDRPVKGNYSDVRYAWPQIGKPFAF
jgi:hypothetical protein